MTDAMTMNHSARSRPDATTILHLFDGAHGDLPAGGLINVGGTLYGASSGVKSKGLIYRIQPSGSGFAVVHAFTNSLDGLDPTGELLYVRGQLWGTASRGGVTSNTCFMGGCGTVFHLDLSGKHFSAYPFPGGRGGANPIGGLVLSDGMLFGTTSAGGGGSSGNGGTIYRIEPDGGFQQLDLFQDPKTGLGPEAPLVASGDVLFGTTSGGGLGCRHECGTIFSMLKSGKELHIMHYFKGGSDGSNPAAAMIIERGQLYGTTTKGGDSTVCDGGCGTVFTISTTGANYKVLYAFRGSPDGATPMAGVRASDGILYGTTSAGGGSSACAGGCGTLYKLATTGADYSTLYSFSGGTEDGANPGADLLEFQGRLFGTTNQGGKRTRRLQDGLGVIFASAK